MASMTTERVAVVVSPHVATMSTCGCGQALETCHTEHCPRCGVNLHLHA